MSDKQSSPPKEGEKNSGDSPKSSDDEESMIPFVTQAFTNSFNQITKISKDFEALNATIIQIDKNIQSRLQVIESQISEILSVVREQRRSSVTHYSHLAATVTQGFESLGEIRSAETDRKTLDLLKASLQAVHDALYCLRMERLITRYLELQGTLKQSPSARTSK
ncbi:MAG: hypothetical protein ACFFDP_12835 [Promethearchaeota archaeon]